MNLSDLSLAQVSALAAFAKANGRTWKNKLSTAWMNGNYRDFAGADDSASLQQVRNEYGPELLAKITTKSLLNFPHLSGIPE